MTDRTRPRLLAVSQIPPDLRAALAQRYELADHAALATEGPRRDSTSRSR